MIAFPEPLELSSVELGPGLETETKNVSTVGGRSAKGETEGPVPDWALGLTGGFSTGPGTRTSPLKIEADLDDGQSVAGHQITILARMSAQDEPEVASAREGTLLARDGSWD